MIEKKKKSKIRTAYWVKTLIGSGEKVNQRKWPKADKTGIPSFSFSVSLSLFPSVVHFSFGVAQKSSIECRSINQSCMGTGQVRAVGNLWKIRSAKTSLTRNRDQHNSRAIHGKYHQKRSYASSPLLFCFIWACANFSRSLSFLRIRDEHINALYPFFALKCVRLFLWTWRVYLVSREDVCVDLRLGIKNSANAIINRIVFSSFLKFFFFLLFLLKTSNYERKLYITRDSCLVDIRHISNVSLVFDLFIQAYMYIIKMCKNFWINYL